MEIKTLDELADDYIIARNKYLDYRLQQAAKIVQILKDYNSELHCNNTNWIWIKVNKPSAEYYFSLQPFDRDSNTGNYHILQDRIGIFYRDGKSDLLKVVSREMDLNLVDMYGNDFIDIVKYGNHKNKEYYNTHYSAKTVYSCLRDIQAQQIVEYLKKYLKEKIPGVSIRRSAVSQNYNGDSKRKLTNAPRKKLKTHYDLNNWKYITVHFENKEIIIVLQTFNINQEQRNYLKPKRKNRKYSNLAYNFEYYDKVPIEFVTNPFVTYDRLGIYLIEDTIDTDNAIKNMKPLSIKLPFREKHKEILKNEINNILKNDKILIR